MKHLLKATICAFVLFTISACEKKENNSQNNSNTNTTQDSTNNQNSNNPVTTGVIKFDLNGKTYTTNTNSHALAMNTEKSVIAIGGTGKINDNLFDIKLNIVDCNRPGTFTIPQLSIDKIYASHAIFSDQNHGGYECKEKHPEASGTIIVSEYVKGESIKGTFNFKAVKVSTTGSGNTIEEFTNGEFNIKF